MKLAAVCPFCGAANEIKWGKARNACPACRREYDKAIGNAIPIVAVTASPPP